MAPLWGKSSSSKKIDQPEVMSIGEFVSKANDFLNEVEDKTLPSFFNRRGDTLGDMLRWAKHSRNERSEMRIRISHQRIRLQQADEHINGLEHTRMNMELEIGHSRSVRQNLVRERDQLADQNARQVTDILLQHSAELARLKDEHMDGIIRLDKKHQEDKNELLRQLLFSQKDDQGWPDDKMKHKFRELQRLMESVTAPKNRELLIPKGQKVPSHLDKLDFLGRRKNTKSHLFLQSILWNILCEQFFSAPFGFGVLGPGQSQKPLFEMYATWRNFFDANTVAASPEREDYAVFKQDVLANNWRSSIFQYINAALAAQEQSGSPVTKLATENINSTVARIMSVLSEIASLSHSTVRTEIEDQVRQMAILALDIAIQFGIQPAQLQLVIPTHREAIEIGDRFHDCQDEDSGTLKTCTVDIVTLPGLQKVGDGRSHMDVQRPMVPCEIYPMEAEDDD